MKPDFLQLELNVIWLSDLTMRAIFYQLSYMVAIFHKWNIGNVLEINI